MRCWCNGIADIKLAGTRTRIENVTPGRYRVDLIEVSAASATAVGEVDVREGASSTLAIE